MTHTADDSPIEIGDRIYWVGHYLEDDRFQCHAYLLEHDDNSVLFDPGSALTFPHTLRKIEKVIPFTKIRYFVCHHQDPDITGAMPLIDQINCRHDSRIVTHWRAVVLLRHLNLKMPFWEVSENGWQLDLGGRQLEFVFTPYLHFPGAITTFDKKTGTLFSSDLFGGFTDGGSLFAPDITCFEGIRAFHAHYMPSREILLSGLLRLEQLPIKLIAPQHGQVLREDLVTPIIERLKGLDCGLYLLTQRDSRVERLLKLSETLRAMLRTLHVERELRAIGAELLRIIREVIPANELDFLVRTKDGFMLLEPESRYRGVPFEPHQLFARAFGLHEDEVRNHFGAEVCTMDGTLALPLYSSDQGRVEGLALIRLPDAFVIDAELARMLAQVAIPLAVAVERENILRQLEHERDAIFAQSIRDPLTDLYTRRHMNEVVLRLVALHDRDKNASFAVLVVDLDHFKSINDTYGHPVGDAVLKGVAEVLKNTIRASDIAIRYGGEELIILANVLEESQAVHLAERIRERIEQTAIAAPCGAIKVTASLGVALRHCPESFADCLRRADAALYEAKQQGRNRVCPAPRPD